MTAVRRFGPAAATSAVVALLLEAVYRPWFGNYDARYALLWASDAVSGARGVTKTKRLHHCSR